MDRDSRIVVRRSICWVLTVCFLLIFSSPIRGAELFPGRYQAMVIGQGNEVFIVDSKEGHCWEYQAEGKSLRYLGQIRPGSEPREILNEPREKTLEELREEKEALQEQIEREESALEEETAAIDETSVVDARTDLQKAIARAKLKEELKDQMIEKLEAKDIRERLKREMIDMIRSL